LRSARVDHVHCHFATKATAVAMLCHELGGPTYSFTVHGPHEFDKPEAIALREKITRAAFVVAISSFTKSQLLRWCSYKQWSKIHVVHCGVDQLFLSQPHTPLTPHPSFVCVGRISEQKGHLILLEAISMLATQGEQFKVVLVGDGPLRSDTETLIHQLKLQGYIEITGWATNAEVQRHILNSQVMVVPSFAEGLPVVVMEALALGRPVGNPWPVWLVGARRFLLEVGDGHGHCSPYPPGDPDRHGASRGSTGCPRPRRGHGS
jgi:glycosyltransferase involved in cell wall biosynthesis